MEGNRIASLLGIYLEAIDILNLVNASSIQEARGNLYRTKSERQLNTARENDKSTSVKAATCSVLDMWYGDCGVKCVASRL